MNFFFRLITISFLCSTSFYTLAQDQSKGKAPASSRMQYKAAKQKWKEQRKLEMEHRKAVKEHDKRLQTKKTRKNMRKMKRKSEKLKSNKRETFFIRWFKYRH
jgi:hypothetical protein